MNSELINNWTILESDDTLSRAMKKSKIIKVTDYQKDQLDIALSFCKNFRHAIDIGANYGIMSYNMSLKFDKVSSFEIVPEVNDCLKLNISNFNLKNVDIYDCGLGNKDELVSLNFDPKNTFSTHIDSSGSVCNARVKTLDSFNFEDVDFIKIDAEGFEPFIIDGAIDTILKYKPVILYERKGHEQRYGLDKSRVLEILKPYGYANLANVGSKNGLIGVL
jgi:FkbM family methyltransferase